MLSPAEINQAHKLNGRETGMAKGYWIARVDVHNMDGYKEYVAKNGAVFKKFGARFLVRGGKHESVEGHARSRNVVLEFKDYETALACYRFAGIYPSGTGPLAACRKRPHVIEGYDGEPAPERFPERLIGCRSGLLRLYGNGAGRV